MIGPKAVKATIDTLLQQLWRPRGQVKALGVTTFGDQAEAIPAICQGSSDHFFAARVALRGFCAGLQLMI